MSRPTRVARTIIAGTCAALVGVAVASPPAAAADKPLAQSVGRFVDGSVGGMPIQSLADVHDARAVAPGTTSQQNPLDATLLGQAEVPLGNALKLPGGGVFTLGALNQVAVAKSDGYAYGASGAVSNSGGVALGGNDKAFPANATITLSSASLGSVPIPGLPSLPGGGMAGGTSAAALGGVSATIGAVSALAQTKSGGDAVTPQYQIGGLTLRLGSPALGALLSQLAKGGSALTGLLNSLVGKLGGTLPAGCSLTPGTVPSTISLDGGAVVIDPAKATITIDVAKLLAQLRLDLNRLPANTDLLAYVLGNLGKILSQGLENVIDGILTPLQDLGDKCLAGLPASVRTILGTLLGSLTSQQKMLEKAINSIADELSSAGAAGLKQLTDALAQAVAIGVNVESGPGKAADNGAYPFTSKLDATPDQATPAVSGQTLVRALELDLGGGTAAVLALGNAAAGPSTPAVAPSSSPTPTTAAPTTSVPATVIPTGVPAGRADIDRGPPTLPLVLLVLGLMMALGAGVTWRLRGGRHLP